MLGVLVVVGTFLLSAPVGSFSSGGEQSEDASSFEKRASISEAHFSSQFSRSRGGNRAYAVELLGNPLSTLKTRRRGTSERSEYEETAGQAKGAAQALAASARRFQLKAAAHLTAGGAAHLYRLTCRYRL